MAEDRLYQDAALARFYDAENPWAPDQAFCLDLARGCRAVLDLGCGTGTLAIRIARETGADVTAVDAADAMLAIAAAKPGGDRVRWLRGDARTLSLAGRFDLITLTGHAFQFFLTDGDRAACLATIAACLSPGGRFVFDSRKPLSREWETWRPATSRRAFDDPDLGRIVAWNDVSWDEDRQIATYETVYRREADGREVRAASRIGFITQKHLARLIANAGLTIDRWLGDWTGADNAPGSPEIIPLGRLA